MPRLPVWLQLDGRLHGCRPREPALCELRSVVDPRTGKGCGEVHGRLRRLVGDLEWAAVLLGFSRVTRAADGQDGLLLIAERRGGLQAAAAAADAAKRRRAEERTAGGGGDGGGDAAAAAGLKKRPASEALGDAAAAGGGAGGIGFGAKRLRRAVPVPLVIDGPFFWYLEVGASRGGSRAGGGLRRPGELLSLARPPVSAGF
jgi:hypothetical protein